MRKLLALLAAFLLFAGGELFAQKTITGKVTDDKGNPIPNTSVIVKGTNTGTVSKVDGTYSLAVPKSATALIFSSVGMATQEVRIGSQNEIDISLSPEDKILTDVVVIISQLSGEKQDMDGVTAITPMQKG